MCTFGGTLADACAAKAVSPMKSALAQMCFMYCLLLTFRTYVRRPGWAIRDRSPIAQRSDVREGVRAARARNCDDLEGLLGSARQAGGERFADLNHCRRK